MFGGVAQCRKSPWERLVPGQHLFHATAVTARRRRGNWAGTRLVASPTISQMSLNATRGRSMRFQSGPPFERPTFSGLRPVDTHPFSSKSPGSNTVCVFLRTQTWPRPAATPVNTWSFWIRTRYGGLHGSRDSGPYAGMNTIDKAPSPLRRYPKSHVLVLSEKLM
ncbi:hypothetical protein VTK26DRAFT_4949 [Humicola hyalothermophila]